MSDLPEEELYRDAEEANGEVPVETTEQGFFQEVEEVLSPTEEDNEVPTGTEEDEEIDHDYLEALCFGISNVYDRDDDADRGKIYNGGFRCNPQKPSTSMAKIQPQLKVLNKYENLVNLGKFEFKTLPTHATQALSKVEKRLENNRIRNKDKADRATTEQVLDYTTKLIVFELMQNDVLSAMNGCISTGKEANVYYAESSSGPRAVKIYRTSIMEFKDRDEYVTGDYRMRSGYGKNPRKMVATWAEKEHRNLMRLASSGIKAPEAIRLKNHVLVMSFLGHDGWPAPKLKDVIMTHSDARKLYREIIIIIWKMYHKCKLVHGDLSEFNILYFNEDIYIIDVSQSVGHEHPKAREFLIRDCDNISMFFKKRGVATATCKDLHKFILDSEINDENLQECLDALSEKAARNIELTPEEQVEDEVFRHSYKPTCLTDVVDYERDINLAKSGMVNDLIYPELMGLKPDLSGVITNPYILEEKKESQRESEDTVAKNPIVEANKESATTIGVTFGENPIADEKADTENCDNNSVENSESSDSDEESRSKFVDGARPKHETLEEKKARKKSVKEAQADKRKVKVKKHVKKRGARANKK